MMLHNTFFKEKKEHRQKILNCPGTITTKFAKKYKISGPAQARIQPLYATPKYKFNMDGVLAKDKIFILQQNYQIYLAILDSFFAIKEYLSLKVDGKGVCINTTTSGNCPSSIFL